MSATFAPLPAGLRSCTSMARATGNAVCPRSGTALIQRYLAGRAIRFLDASDNIMSWSHESKHAVLPRNCCTAFVPKAELFHAEEILMAARFSR